MTPTPEMFAAFCGCLTKPSPLRKDLGGKKVTYDHLKQSALWTYNTAKSLTGATSVSGAMANIIHFVCQFYGVPHVRGEERPWYDTLMIELGSRGGNKAARLQKDASHVARPLVAKTGTRSTVTKKAGSVRQPPPAKKAAPTRGTSLPKPSTAQPARPAQPVMQAKKKPTRRRNKKNDPKQEELALGA